MEFSRIYNNVTNTAKKSQKENLDSTTLPGIRDKLIKEAKQKFSAGKVDFQDVQDYIPAA